MRFLLLLLFPLAATAQSALSFQNIPTRWDEGLPLGNGMLGALVWNKNGHLRLSLDRADLWDSRPMKDLHRPEFSYNWVVEQVKKKDYAVVQQYFDQPYDREPAPSKIPGGALEWDIQTLGPVKEAALDIRTAEARIVWQNGATFRSFVDAAGQAGWFRFEHLPAPLGTLLQTPTYAGPVVNSGNPVEGDDLSRLGYQQGPVVHKKVRKAERWVYHQVGWGGFEYEIAVTFKTQKGGVLEGCWTITSGANQCPSAEAVLDRVATPGYQKALEPHQQWWAAYWAQSSLHVPDPQLERQWYLEMYKFGASSRAGAPPISLQAIWTADNGRLPPWKGDFHHDLNTELSYWPGYSANHLPESQVLLDHLLANTPNYQRYTQQFFGQKGLAVPGVTTLDGTEMGGWIQYSLSPTVSCWLAQHFYLQWRYSMDHEFLEQKAYPWVKEVAFFINKMAAKNRAGISLLPISSSPEFNDNSLDAWFLKNTNYDVALMRNMFRMAEEMAAALGKTSEAERWRNLGSELAPLALDPQGALLVAPDYPYRHSHRHFSHLMAIHPLGLIRWEDGPEAQRTITRSLQVLDSIGPSEWTGYSYAWQANLKARARDGAGAAQALGIFAKAFCKPNSFHVNGDQTRSGYSSFQYDPFTLEGNCAFAAGLQEMLLQSYSGVIEVMPAVPDAWADAGFEQLRAEGAFLLSAERKAGKMATIAVRAERGGVARLRLPSGAFTIKNPAQVGVAKQPDNVLELDFRQAPTATVTLVFDGK